MLTVIAAGTTFVAVALAGVWAAQGRREPADARLRGLAASGGLPVALDDLPFGARVLRPLADGVGARLAALLPAAFVRRTERRLILAGQPMEPALFFAVMVGLAIGLGLGWAAVMTLVTGGAPPPATLLVGCMLALLGMPLPVLWLSVRASRRQTAMQRALPDALDLLTVCVEAGLGLDAALRQVADKQAGPLAQEVRQTLREVDVGKSRAEALRDLGERLDLDDVRGFVNAVIQAEQLGTSVARLLRVQSQRVRVRRRQRAEQEARRAPVKMVFPLVFCLMPSLFIFILGPIIVSVVEFLQG